MRLAVPFYSQEGTTHCGAASLRMVLAQQGMEKSEEELAHIAEANAHGIRRRKLVAAARYLGFDSQVEYGDVETLQTHIREGIPVLISYVMPEEEIGHYAVVTGYTKDKILLNDPWMGICSLSRQDLSRRWLGYKVRDTTRGWMVIILKR